MKVIAVLCASLAYASAGLIAPATTLLRAPSHDSAVIQSHRFGGNFAYRTDEAHAFASISPVISTVRRPVGVSYSQGAPIVRSTTVEHAAPVAVAAPVATYAAAAPAITTYAAAPAVVGYAGKAGNAGSQTPGLWFPRLSKRLP
ncbi:larval/pupal cuticle protein H1C-like [Pollicipes pollicipes]|uniref:larval/pupal cuticle protein H1C-like n=1 Tax=Pollicipes pollicipes TaxID=41117 RepID=UPI00188544EF|nr:larval/pupal cuticle protein H1C-like [Pollicipes pollicipes]